MSIFVSVQQTLKTMKKTIVFFIGFSLFLNACSEGEEKKEKKAEDLPPPKDMFLDAKAEEILDGMSQNIGTLNSCSFTLHAAEKSSEDSLFQPTKQYDVYFKDSDKLHVHAVSADKDFSIWFNGEAFEYFNYLNHTFDSIAFSGTTMEMIAKLNEEKGYKFPGADFFSPSLTDDLVQLCDSVIYIGDTTVSEVNFSVIKANNPDLDIYLFINNSKNLPGGLFFHNKTKETKYKSMFMNWQLNPKLPDAIFEFSAPTHAEKINLKNI